MFLKTLTVYVTFDFLRLQVSMGEMKQPEYTIPLLRDVFALALLNYMYYISNKPFQRKANALDATKSINKCI